jgi:hydrogenase-1 operon protein HyaE
MSAATTAFFAPRSDRLKTLPHASPDLSRLLTLFARYVATHGFHALPAAGVQEFVALPGDAMLFFSEDPRRVPETWDVAVVLPDLVRLSPRPLRVALLDPTVARALASSYGVDLWPSLVFTREGRILGRIERMRDWDEYAQRIPRIVTEDTEVVE